MTYSPSKAEILAGLVTGNAAIEQYTSTIQKSHRFKFADLMFMENMAKKADCKLSVIINQVIEVGIDALSKELPEEVYRELSQIDFERLEREQLIPTEEKVTGKKS